MPVKDFIELLVRHGRGMHWLLKQVVHQVGALLDSEVLQWWESSKQDTASGAPKKIDDDSDEAIVDAELLLAGPASKRKQRTATKMKTMMAIARRKVKDLALRIFMAFFAMRSVFTDQQNIGMAVDAGTMGCRSRLLGFFTVPTGAGAFGPPQAKLQLYRSMGLQPAHQSPPFYCNRPQAAQTQMNKNGKTPENKIV